MRIVNRTANGWMSWVAMAIMVACLAPLGGCRLCADCEDLAYPAYGGAWQRTRRNEGRVGSIFDPGGAKASELVSRDTPPDTNELERQRQEGIYSLDDRDLGIPGDEEPMEEDDDATDRENELRDRTLDDIEGENEDELRKKNLDDINVRLIPGQPMPPVLR